jgi:hypothetical protein
MKMKHWVKSLAGLVALATLFFGVAVEGAQGQEEDAQPKPAARTSLPPLDMTVDDTNLQPSDNLQPDMRPLTGVQNPTLGTAESRHSYWVPGLQYGNLIQSQPFSQGQPSGWNSNNYLTGNVSLLNSWSHSQLSLNFSGGGNYSTNSAQGGGFFSQLGLIQAFAWKRWQLQFIDQFGYLPESQFGFGGATSLGVPGVGGALGSQLPGIRTNYLPNQSIFTSLGPRYTNSFVTQATYELSPRGSITLAGSYGILRFIDLGNINSDDVIANFGYNYNLTRKNTIGVSYRFSSLHYGGNPQAMGDHVINVAYGRKITGRLALQLFGGPEVITFRVPIGSITSRVMGSGGASLTYGLYRGELSLNYNQGVTDGSGTLVGANTSQVTFVARRQLSRLWNGNVNFGFARNQNVATTISANSQSYNSWFFGFGLVRPVGRYANLSFGYTGYIQTSSLPICVTGRCSTSYTQNQVSLGLQWHAPPQVIH